MTSNDIAYTRDIKLRQSTVQILEEWHHDQRKILGVKACRYDEFLVPAKVPNYPDRLAVMVVHIIIADHYCVIKPWCWVISGDC